MKLNSFVYLYPPRPRTAIKFGSDNFRRLLASGEWIAQPKLNGQRTLIYVDPEGQLQFWDRHKKPSSYQFPEWLVDDLKQVLNVPRGEWSVFDSELLHLKDKHIKNTIYIFDMLVRDGKFLLNTTYSERHEMLREITGADSVDSDGMATKLTEHVWVADSMGPDLWEDKWSLTNISYVEGFVLKKADAKLAPCVVPKNNSGWQIRCRKPTKNYGF